MKRFLLPMMFVVCVSSCGREEKQTPTNYSLPPLGAGEGGDLDCFPTPPKPTPKPTPTPTPTPKPTPTPNPCPECPPCPNCPPCPDRPDQNPPDQNPPMPQPPGQEPPTYPKPPIQEPPKSYRQVIVTAYCPCLGL